MPVKIRLQRKGRKRRPYYHIVVADVRAPRDGKYIERIGMYNPMTKPATIEVDRDKAYDWLMKGAQPTDTARAILKFKGVYYKKHLMRGVKKGALTQEEADKMYEDWVAQKEARIAERFEASVREKAEYHAAVSGQPPVVAEPEPEPETEGTTEAETETQPTVEAETQEAETPAANAETEETADESSDEAAETEEEDKNS